LRWRVAPRCFFYGKVRYGIRLYDRLAPGVLEELKKANPKDEITGRRKSKHFQWLTSNIGYPKLREHLGAVIATMKLSADWHDFKAKLDTLRKRKKIPARASKKEAAG
jgi:hypothetical protein